MHIKVRDNALNEASYTPIVITGVTHTPNTWTTGNVTVGIQASSTTTGIKDYSFDGGETWQTSNTYVFTDYASDVQVIARNNDNDYWMEIIDEIKIDREAPEIDTPVDVIDPDFPTVAVLAEDIKSGTEVIKWATGEQPVTYFTVSGTQLEEDEYSFNGEWGVTYTVYAKDSIGNASLKTITVDENNFEPVEVEEAEETLHEGSTEYTSYGAFDSIMSEETMAKYFVVANNASGFTVNEFDNQTYNQIDQVSLEEPLVLIDANNCEAARAYEFSHDQQQGIIIVSSHTRDVPYQIINNSQITLDENNTYYYFTNLQQSTYQFISKDSHDVFTDCLTGNIISTGDFTQSKESARMEFESRDAHLVELFEEDNVELLLQINNLFTIYEKELQNNYGEFSWNIAYDTVAQYLVYEQLAEEENITFDQMQTVSLLDAMVVYDQNEIASALAYNFIMTIDEENDEEITGYIVISTHTKQPILLDFSSEVMIDEEEVSTLYFVNGSLYNFDGEIWKDIEGNIIEEGIVPEPLSNHDEEESFSQINQVKSAINNYLNEAQNCNASEWTELTPNGNHDTEVLYALQLLLCQAGYEVTVDGLFSNETETAITALQSDNELPETGVLNEETFSALIASIDAPKKSVQSLAVQAVQYLLQNRHGYVSGPQRGHFGYVTQYAIDEFQQKNELSLDGMVGYDTWKLLFSAISSQESYSRMSGPSMATASTPIGPKYGTYYIKNLYSGKYLTMNRTTAGAVQYSFHGRSNQMWRVGYSSAKGGFRFRPLYRETRALKVSNNDYNSEVTLKASNTGRRTYWDFYPKTANTYIIYSDFVPEYYGLHVENKSNNTKVKHVRVTDFNNKRFQWKFERMLTKLASYKNKKGNEKVQLFAGFDVGTTEKSKEETLFRDGMKKFGGFTEIASLNNDKTYSYRSPETVRAISRAVDVTYINSHGAKYGYLWFAKKMKNGSFPYTYAALAPNMNAAVSKGAPSKRTKEIGADWKDDNNRVKTHSIYKDTAKWLILGGCGLLNYGPENAEEYNPGPFWEGMNAAQLWARTMRGDGKMLHGILGYYRLAPKGEGHKTKLKSFLDLANAGYSYVNAWIYGNGNPVLGGPPWAVLVRGDCSNEAAIQKMQPKTSASSIHLYRYHHLPSYTLPLDGQSRVTSADYTFQFNEVAPEGNIENAEVELIEKDFSQEEKNKITSLLSSDSGQKKANSSGLQDYSPIKLDITDDGELHYKRDFLDLSEVNLNCRMKSEDAISVAESKLEELGILPDSNYRADIDYVSRQKVPLTALAFEEPEEIVSYTVRFYPQINGRDLLTDEKNVILVTLCKNGISEIYYNWR